MNFAQALTANKVQGTRVDSAALRSVASGEAQVEGIARKLLLADVSQATRAAITNSSAGLSNDTGASTSALGALQIAGLLLGSPEFQRK
jgi:hypothetical protein